VNAVGVAISEVPVGLTYPLHLNSGLSYNIAVNGGITLATMFRYWSYKRWVWRPGTTPAGAVPARQAPRHAAPATWPPGFARLLITGFRRLGHELAAFTVISALALLVTDAGTVMLHFRFGVGPLTSNMIATATAIMIAYVGNRHWTFRHCDRGPLAREVMLILTLNVFGLVIQLLCLGVITYVLDLPGRLPYNVALVTGIGLGYVFRYWSYRTWVWKARPPASMPGAHAVPASGPA
jgi:putative flippase GtrA